MDTNGDTDSIGERESVPARFSLVQLDDLELAYGSRRPSEELRMTASDIWVTLLAPGQLITLDRPERERSVLLAYRGEIDIEWDDLSVSHLRPGDLARMHPPTPRALQNTGEGDAAFLTFSERENRDSWPKLDVDAKRLVDSVTDPTRADIFPESRSHQGRTAMQHATMRGYPRHA